MEHNCMHCAVTIDGNFCSNCGQKKYSRINKKYILDEIQYTFLHMNKGFLYSIKNILKNPGKTAKQFIEGDRVSHYKPILLTFVLGGISTFLSFKVMGLKEVMTKANMANNLNSKMMDDYMDLLSNYNAILMVLLVPFFALTTKVAFRKWGHNYFEHVVMNAYILSFYTLISILLVYPIMFGCIYLAPNNVINVSLYSLLLVPLILTYFFKQFYPDKSLSAIILRVLAIIGLLLATYLILIVLVGIGVAIYVAINGPEALQYLKPQ